MNTRKFELLRDRYFKTGVAMAKALGCTPTRITHCLQGRLPIHDKELQILHTEHHIDLNWLYAQDYDYEIKFTKDQPPLRVYAEMHELKNKYMLLLEQHHELLRQE